MPNQWSLPPSPRRWSWTSSGLILFLIAASGVGTLGLVVLSAVWAGAESDVAALDRQRHLVEGRLHDQVERVRQDIRLMAAGYSSLLLTSPGSKTQSTLFYPLPVDVTAMGTMPAETFGKIATTVFGYDAAFLVLSDGDLSLQANADMRRRYRWVRPLLQPMLRHIQEEASLSGKLSQESSVELMRLEGRPSIVGIVPVTEAQNPDLLPPQAHDADAHYLIAFRFLDGAALDALSREQGLNGARFSRTADQENEEVAFQIEATASREPIGFIIWKPDLPGSRVIGRLVPSLSVAALVIAVLFLALIGRLRQSLAELKESELHARHLSLHDVLTTLPNRAKFAARFEECLRTLRMTNRRAAIALIDLDKFKAVNDSFGHAAGDELIQQVAERMLSLIGPEDMLARLGGDEFALLLPDIGSGQDYRALCDRVVDELATPFVLRQGEAVAHVGCSIGIAIAEDATRQASEIMRSADIALYEAKVGGRGRCVEYRSTMDEGAQAREGLKNDLRAVLESADEAACDAVDKPGLRVYFQGVHRGEGPDRIAGAEALVRWHHPQQGLLTPDKFIAVAEEGGLMDALGLWVLRHACRAAAEWPDDTMIAVNVSPTQLRSRNFEAEVLRAIEESGLGPHRLELELTEAAFFNVDAAAKATLARLRARGLRIALDDFGTGFSSLSHLTQFGIDRIKIDRSFVKLLGTRAEGAAVVSSVVGLARNLGIAVTAEGVETEAQKDFLTAVGCSEFQGYLFSRPRPLQDFLVAYPRLAPTAPDRVLLQNAVG